MDAKEARRAAQENRARLTKERTATARAAILKAVHAGEDFTTVDAPETLDEVLVSEGYRVDRYHNLLTISW